MGAADLTALWVTLQLAMVTTLVLLLVGTPLALWLARTRWRGRAVVEAIVALPLVLPPTVLGFYLLVALGKDGPLASWGIEPLFSFTGLVIGSVIYSLPFVVQPLVGAFSALPERQLEVAATLGATSWERFWQVMVPQARVGFITATVLGFAHTVGEFGVVLMIGGSIAGETRVASIAIFDHVESMDYGSAHALSAVLLVFSFAVLCAVFALRRRAAK